MKSKIANVMLIFIQLVGYFLMFFLKWRHLAPIAEMLNISLWWEFSATAIWALMVALPAVYAYVKRLPCRWLTTALAVLPMAIVLLLAVAGICLHGVRAYHIQQERMQRFGEPAKIEQVTGVRFPDYHIVEYSETPIPNDFLRRRVCRVSAEFDSTPSAVFYQQLDSLCRVDSAHWQMGNGTYAYDSIYGEGQFSKLVLGLVLSKNKKDFEIRYDDGLNFTIKTRRINN